MDIEYTKEKYEGGDAYDLDKAILVGTIRELIPLMMKYKDDLQATPLDLRTGENTKNLTEWDMMVWGLVSMLDPFLYTVAF